MSSLKILLGAGMIVAGCLHFVFPSVYARIIPAYLPWSLLLVFVSGICEVGLGAGLFTRFAPLAAWGLIALFVAVFPANLHMALHPELFPKTPAAALWGRLPLQAVLIAWAYWYT